MQALLVNAHRGPVDEKNLAISILLIACVVVGCASEPAPLKTWEHSTSGLFEAAVSNDGNFAVVSSFNEGTSFWDLEKNKRLFDWRHQQSGENNIGLAVFSTNDSHVLTADSRTFVIWSTVNGEALGYWAVEADILDAALSDDAKHILLGLKDGRALHINRLTGRRLEVIAHRSEWVTSLAMSHDGKTVATGGNDKRVMVWDAESGDELGVFEHTHRVVKVAFDRAGKQILTADENSNAFIWSLRSNKLISTLKLKRDELHVVEARFSASGDRLLLGFPGRNIGLWSTKSGKRLQRWVTPTRKFGWVPQGSTVYAVAFAGNEKAIVAQSSNGLGGKYKIL